MKKFLIFFMVMFGMACGAMAGDYHGVQKNPGWGESLYNETSGQG